MLILVFCVVFQVRDERRNVWNIYISLTVSCPVKCGVDAVKELRHRCARHLLGTDTLPVPKDSTGVCVRGHTHNVMDKQGCRGARWKLTAKLSQNLTTTIRTAFENTRPIKTYHKTNQKHHKTGGVLALTQYSTLMDEISKSRHRN